MTKEDEIKKVTDLLKSVEEDLEETSRKVNKKVGETKQKEGTTPQTSPDDTNPETQNTGGNSPRFVGKISGWVQDGDVDYILPIEGAEVKAVSQTANWSRKTLTGNTGSFEIDVPEGIYSVHAKARGYGLHRKPGIHVSKGSPVQLTFLLHKIKRPNTTPPITEPPGIGQQPPSGPPPKIIRFEAIPDTINLGQTANLELEAENTDYVVVRDSEGNEGQYPPRGIIPVNPAKNTTYTATAYGNGTARATTRVNVRQPPAPVPPAPTPSHVSPTIPQPFRTQIEQPPDDRFRTESQVSGAGGGPIETRSEVSGPGGRPIENRISGELTVKQADREEWGQVRGRVIDAVTNSPIGDVNVTNREDSATTNSDGSYELNARAGLSSQVVAEKEGYSRGGVRSPVVVARGVVNAPDIRLRPQNTGRLRYRIIDDETRNLIQNATIGVTGPSPTSFGSLTGTDILGNLEPGNYKVKATHPQYAQAESEEISIEAGETKIVTLRMKKKKGVGERLKKVQKDAPLFTFKWLKANGVRIALALGLTILFFTAFYGPLFGALGQNLPWWINVILPFLFFLIMFYTLPKPGSGTTDWVNLIISIILAVGTWTAIKLSPLSGGTFIQWGLPVAVYLLSFYTTKNSKSPIKTLVTTTGILLIIGGVLLVWNLIFSGAAFQIETYLKALDVLHLIGVPQETIDSFKQGVRDTLSFLQFKGAEPVKPEAKKIGGFEAIELKFGSRYNDYILPTLFARMDYSLPVTITNPNKFDTKLVVKDFIIEDIFLNNGSDKRIICGDNGADEKGNGKIELDDIEPESEKLTTIEFKGKTTIGDGAPYGPASGKDVNCKDVFDYKDRAPENPMYPIVFRVFGGDPTKDKDANIQECINKCREFISRSNTNYNLSSPGNVLDESETRYIKSDGKCECSAKRYYNIMDDLCFLDDNKAKITLSSNYGFSVQGKGELILVKMLADRKLAPKPVITSSAGPLTVTTYFVSDAHVFEPKQEATTMFIQITNDGGGTARIKGMSINEIDVSELIKKDIDKIELLKDDPGKVTIASCLPNPTLVSIGKESTTIICKLNKIDDSSKSIISGSYKTVPVIVDVDYTYSESHSTTINVKKEVIPEEVKGERAKELNVQFFSLPYYCPTKRISDPGYNVEPLNIYSPQPKDSGATTECISKQTTFCTTWRDSAFNVQPSGLSWDSNCEELGRDECRIMLKCDFTSSCTDGKRFYGIIQDYAGSGAEKVCCP